MGIFEQELHKINIVKVSLQKYLKNSLASGKEDDLCRGWDYLKINITPELREILLQKEYWDLKYNSEKISYIIAKIMDLSTELKEQLGSFVYVYNSMKRDIEKKYQHEETEKKMLSEGYKKILNTQKELHGLNVKCIMDISHIGCLGSFDKQEEKEGKLFWTDGYGGVLMLIPKRCRSRGHIIKEYAYIKEII
jgi:hypothetical protein